MRRLRFSRKAKENLKKIGAILMLFLLFGSILILL
jgi:hypothetical protein